MRLPRSALALALPIATTCLAAPPADQLDPPTRSLPATSVTPEQVSPSSAPRSSRSDRDAEVNVTQPAQPPRSSAVTASEVSQRADGRALAVTPVTGDDRCDPARSRTVASLCRRRIEGRAGQYTRPSPAPVTPEARLLLLADPDGTGGGGKGGARQSGAPSTLGGPNGPMEQLVGALGNTRSDQAPDAAADTLPTNLSPIIILPRR